MAKAKEKEKEVVAKEVTVADLAEEFGIEGRVIRQLLRKKLNLKAPAVEGQTGFGPRAKYVWTEGSPELAKVRKAIEEYLSGAEEEEVEDKE